MDIVNWNLVNYLDTARHCRVCGFRRFTRTRFHDRLFHIGRRFRREIAAWVALPLR